MLWGAPQLCGEGRGLGWPPPGAEVEGHSGPPHTSLTVKLLLMFLVLVSATLASDRSTSSKIRDCGGETGAPVHQAGISGSSPGLQAQDPWLSMMEAPPPSLPWHPWRNRASCPAA